MAKTAAELKAQVTRLTGAAENLDRVSVIDARLEELKAEAKKTGGPLPGPEIEERLVEWLRSRRASFEAGTGSGLTAGWLVSSLSAGKAPRFGSLAPWEDIATLLIWLSGPELELKAREAVKRLNLPKTMGSAERAALTSKLEAERTALTDERERVVEELREAGVQIDHLPETAQKHAHAANLERAAEASAAYQEKRQARIDEQHERERLEAQRA